MTPLRVQLLDGERDLAVGEPVFLRDSLEDFYPISDSLRPVEPSYPAAEGSADLRHAVVKFLGYGRAEHVVITNGALQGLAASLASVRSIRRITSATARTPYFPYFKPLAKGAGLDWLDAPGAADWADLVEILAWPNNPTGSDPGYYSEEEGFSSDLQIWDAAYAHPQYGVTRSIYGGPSGFVTGCEAIVGSGAKAFGIPGLRVGWAIFNDELHARKAAEYVEFSTAGVSTLSQEYLRALLRKIETNNFAWVSRIERARRALLEAGTSFNCKLSPFMEDVRGVPVGHGGMFAYFQPKDPERFDNVCEKLQIRLANGAAFGDDWSWYRMNLGADNSVLESCLDDLQKELA